jgi:hypothetical protein
MHTIAGITHFGAEMSIYTAGICILFAGITHFGAKMTIFTAGTILLLLEIEHDIGAAFSCRWLKLSMKFQK